MVVRSLVALIVAGFCRVVNSRLLASAILRRAIVRRFARAARSFTPFARSLARSLSQRLVDTSAAQNLYGARARA